MGTSAAPGRPWSEQETSHLISAYDQVWHSLNRGHLTVLHWDRVASLASRLSGPALPPRSGTQCRHKMEKLRKRYREEKKLLTRPSHWPHFRQIDRMEHGGGPPVVEEEREEEEEEEEEQEEDGMGEVARRLKEDLGKLERRSADVMREMARDWMQMEERRARMVADSERWTLDAIAKAFHPSKKPRTSRDHHL